MALPKYQFFELAGMNYISTSCSIASFARENYPLLSLVFGLGLMYIRRNELFGFLFHFKSEVMKY